ncbi:MAG: tyrosine-type recombinase/integrase, partial [Bacteroidales bacterium]|nr:tyrosine-type recombinase/integrase [Bacteroidales bacterium]
MNTVHGRQIKQQLQQKFNTYYRQIHQQQTDPVSLYLESLAPTGRRSIKSLLCSATEIAGFEGQLEEMPWNLIEYQHLALIRNTLKQEGKSANTINLALSAVRGVMKACFYLKLITAEQMLLLKGINAVRSQRLPSGRSLNKGEVAKLHRSCKLDKTVIGKRDYAVIALLLATGIRRSEVIAITIDDYNTRTGVLNIQAGKGDKQRTAYLNTESRIVVRHWLTERGQLPGSLFNPVTKTGTVLSKALSSQTIYDIIKQRSEQAKIDRVRPHDLRRTFVT